MRALATSAVAVLLFVAPAGALPVFQNGDFEAGFTYVNDDSCPTSWSMVETWYGGTGETSIVNAAADNGPSAPGESSVLWHRSDGEGSGDWTGIEQVCNPMINVSEVEHLGLSFDLKVISHSLGGSGWTEEEWEYPVTVVVYFLDENDRARYWQHGYYGWIDDPTGPAPHGLPVNDREGIVYSTQVPVGQWVSQSFDLLAQLRTLAEPKSITRIRLAGSGWNFEGQVDNVWFFIRPTAVRPMTFGAIKALYR